MYLTLGQVGNNSFCDRFTYVFALFHAFHNLFTPHKTPSFPTRPPTFLGVLRVFCHLSLTLEHKIRCFLVISLVFTVKIDAAVVWNWRIYLRFPWNLQPSSTLSLWKLLQNWLRRRWKYRFLGFLDHRKYSSALETSSCYLVYDWLKLRHYWRHWCQKMSLAS